MQHSENERQKFAAGPSQRIRESGIFKEDWQKDQVSISALSSALRCFSCTFNP
jgi:hypothetical protein